MKKFNISLQNSILSLSLVGKKYKAFTLAEILLSELSALFYNKRLFAITDSEHWSSTGASVNAYLLRFDCGYSFNYKKNSTAKVRCIKR